MSSPPPKPLDKEFTVREGWWARKSKRSKIALLALLALLVIGLAVGLGVGLTVGRDNDDDNGDDGDDNGPSGPIETSGPRPEGLWQPAVNASWQIILQKPMEIDSNADRADPDVDIYDLDLFTNDKSVFDKLHSLGKHVICYFSAGSFEPYRPDSNDFEDSDKGGALDGWPDERWLNLNSENVRKIMAKRLQTAYDKGCDAIDPDNMDGYDNEENNLDLTETDSVNFMKFLSDTAMGLNMSIGLKNAAAIIPDVLNITHFSVNEQCVEFSECEDYSAFINDTKPVFHIEYPDSAPSISSDTRTNICSDTGDAQGSYNFSTVMKLMDLDGYVEYCNGATANTTLGDLPS